MIGPVMMLCCVPDGYNMDALPCSNPISEQFLVAGWCCLDCPFCEDWDTQRLSDETIQAHLNGGRTGWLYDDDGNEYYTTVDGVRHYTRDEG